MTVPILSSTWRWRCPNCNLEAESHDARPHTKLHSCPGLHGLIAPFVQVGTKADVRVVEREDYIGAEQVQLHDGRPVMAVVTERPDGQDSMVFAPAARGGTP